MRKEKLINSLTRAVHSLKNDIVKYDWLEQESCNCGIVLQAILGVNAQELSAKFAKELFKADPKDEFRHTKTWLGLVQHTCSSTGIPTEGLLLELFENGMSPEDISHLEYLSNPAILEKGKISLNRVKIQRYVPRKTEKVVGKGFFNQLFNIKYEKAVKAHYKDKQVAYNECPENLIKYLIAWKEILKEELPVSVNTKDGWERKLLQAVADEDYALAAEMRDKINT